MNVKKQYPLLIGLTLVGVLLASSCAPSKSTALGGLEDLNEWDLVVIGNWWASGPGELTGGHSAAELYAAHIHNDLGVTVNVQDRTAASVTATRALDALRNPEDDSSLNLRGWPDFVREAEVVVFAAGPEDLTSDDPWIWQCADLPVDAVDCSPETLETFAADLGAIYEEILRLREGSPTIIRTFEHFAQNPDDWREAGVDDECTRCYEKINAVIRQTAKEHGIPVAPLHDVFNGPNHDQDPREAGYMVHTWKLSEAGRQAIADQLRELGYEPVNQ
jgi:hypothetical protein